MDYYSETYLQNQELVKKYYDTWSIYNVTNNQIMIHNLLVDNVKQLSQNSYHKIQSLEDQLEFKGNQLEKLQTEYTVLKRKYDKLETEKNKQIKKRKTIIYLKSKESYDFKKIKEILSNVKCIEDIINLKKYPYRKIRHNKKLQRLYEIIKPLESLNSMIGLQSIKEQLFKHIIYFIQGNSNDDMLHTVITGPPGVGKTCLGRIIGEIYLGLGLLENDTFKQVKRSDLIGGYLGQTAIKTQEVINSCLGGVLFIDEAYSLGNDRNSDSYSKECIDTINQNLTENKTNFVCIVAGYEDALERCFFRSNDGLKRRFSFKYDIESYNYNELALMFRNKLKEKNWKLCCKVNLEKFFKQHYKHLPNYGGDVETLFFYSKLQASQDAFMNDLNETIINQKSLNDAIEKIKEKKKDKNPIPLGLYC